MNSVLILSAILLANLGFDDVMHTHTFKVPLYGTTRVSWYQKGKTDLDFTEARDSEWPQHQLGHTQVCTSLQTDNHTSTHHSVFYTPDALPATQNNNDRLTAFDPGQPG